MQGLRCTIDELSRDVSDVERERRVRVVQVADWVGVGGANLFRPVMPGNPILSKATKGQRERSIPEARFSVRTLRSKKPGADTCCRGRSLVMGCTHQRGVHARPRATTPKLIGFLFLMA